MTDTPFTLNVADGFGPVADAFRANFADDLEIGAQFCVYKDGQPLVQLTGGYKDRRRSTALAPDDLIAVFSSGKAVAALIVALCVERGDLDYNAPMSRYWPEFAAEGKGDLTLAQCLSHQAGLSGISDPDWTSKDWFDWDKVCAKLAAQHLPVLRHAGCDRVQLNTRRTAKRAKQNSKAGSDRGQCDTRAGVGHACTDPAGYIVPEVPDGLLRLHEIAQVHCRYP